MIFSHSGHLLMHMIRESKYLGWFRVGVLPEGCGNRQEQGNFAVFREVLRFSYICYL